MKKAMVEKVVSLLDPFGIYEICPLDEYSDIAREVYGYLERKEYDKLKSYLTRQYISEQEIEKRKIGLAVEILKYIVENGN